MRIAVALLSTLCAFADASAQPVPPPPPVRAEPDAEAQPSVTRAFSQLEVVRRAQAPAYPPLARLAHLEGEVLLRLTVSPRGGVERVEALEGPKMLRDAAEAYLRPWVFRPVLVEGRPARVQTELRIPFRLGPRPAEGATEPPAKVVVELAQDLPRDWPAPSSERMQAELQAFLERSGLKQVPSSEAGPRDTFQLKVEIQARRLEGLSLCQIRGRCSLWGDRELASNEPGRPQRIAFLGRVLGQKREEGLQDLSPAALKEGLQDLLVLQPRVPPDPKLVKEAAGARIVPGGAGVMGLDFSQIRVMYQPPVPRYPVEAKLNRIQGTVVVELTVDPQGVPVHVAALEGPFPLMLTAIRYALDWRFAPALLNGVPQYARFKLTMPFRLR